MMGYQQSLQDKPMFIKAADLSKQGLRIKEIAS